jgi:hypothetical protein
MWIAKRPLDRAMALSVGATAFNLGEVWGSLQATAVADGGMHGWAGGAALGILARDGRLLRTPPRRTCMTFRAGSIIAKFHFCKLR